MTLEILNTTIVVTAVQHNPSILHPSFLRSQHIVDASWELAEAPVCTPPFSMVKYANDIVFSVETGRLQVVDNSPGESPSKSQLPALASRYVKALPHVRHTAVGINLKGFVEIDQPDKLLIERFLKAGPWQQDTLAPIALGVRLVYQALGTVLRFGLDGGTITKTDQQPGQPGRHGIVLDANYHSDLASDDSIDAVTEAIERYAACCDHLEGTATVILGC